MVHVRVTIPQRKLMEAALGINGFYKNASEYSSTQQGKSIILVVDLGKRSWDSRDEDFFNELQNLFVISYWERSEETEEQATISDFQDQIDTAKRGLTIIDEYLRDKSGPYEDDDEARRASMIQDEVEPIRALIEKLAQEVIRLRKEQA